MRIVDLIQDKKEGKSHSKEEIDFIVENYMNGSIPDYQMSAWLMAVCFCGLSDDETYYLTQAYINSGDIVDFSDISSFVADKHSTGGVGDKVTLVLIPILASLGIKCAKLSGRGLGFTGGTIDKLESIPDFQVELKNEDFKEQIKNIGAAISSQSPNLTPADGRIYALRDVTSTVDNKSLIAASVVSKKIASGATSIVLDVKFGSGAFLKTPEQAQELADLMIKIGKMMNRKIDVVISSMEEPLGLNIGNSLEVIESIEFLKGNYSKDLYDITLEIVYKTLKNKQNITKEEAKALFDKVIEDKSALNKLKEIIIAQKGNPDCLDDYSLFKQSMNKIELKADSNGYITNLDALHIAHAAKLLGAGRDKKSDKIDYSAGISLRKKISDEVQKDETIAVLYFDDISKEKLEDAIKYARLAFSCGDYACAKPNLIYNIS